MGARVEALVGKVRLRLKAVSTAQFADPELYEIINDIQADIMFRTHSNEHNATLNLVKDTAQYSLASLNIHKITGIVPSWDGTFDQKRFPHFIDNSKATGEYPCYYSLQGFSIYLTPAPGLANLTLKVYGYKAKPTVLVAPGLAADLETPEIYDSTLLLTGVLSRLQPEYFPVYEAMIKDAARSVKFAGGLVRESRTI